jgi:hypothetical protein
LSSHSPPPPQLLLSPILTLEKKQKEQASCLLFQTNSPFHVYLPHRPFFFFFILKSGFEKVVTGVVGSRGNNGSRGKREKGKTNVR